MMKAEQRQMVWMEFYLAVVKCYEEDCSAHCDAFIMEWRKNRGYCGHEMLNDFQLINMRSATSGDAFFLHCITKASTLERVTTWRKNGRLPTCRAGGSLLSC